MNDSQNKHQTTFELFAHDKSMSSPLARRIKFPSWQEIDMALENAFIHGGYARLEICDPDTGYIRTLDMTASPGMFRITALTRDSDPKQELIEWWEPGDGGYRGTILLRDHEWDARTICTDKSVAVSIFKELLEHGDLHRQDLADMRSPWNPKP